MHRGERVGERPVASVIWAGAGVLVALVATLVLTRLALEGPGASPRPDEIVLVGLAWLGVAPAAWLGLGCALAIASLVPGAAGRAATRLAERVTPAAVRKLLTLVLGASVASVALPPAFVSTAGTTPVSTSHGTADPVVARDAGTAPALGPGYAPTDLGVAADERPSPGEGPTPDPGPEPGFRPTPPAPVHDGERTTLLAPSPRPTIAVHGRVTARRGDTLWSIARRHLGPDASDAEVAREWPRWYAANRAVIGDDPDLILPGQQLAPPDGGVGTAPTPSKE